MMTTNDKAAKLDEKEEAELAKLEAEANEESKKLLTEGDETPSSESATENQTQSEGEDDKPEGSDSDGGADTSKSEDETPESGEEAPEDEEDIKNLSQKAQKRFKKLSEKAKKADELEAEVAKLRDIVNKPKAPDLKLSGPRGGDKNGKSGLPWDTENSDKDDQFLTEEELDERARNVAREEMGKVAQLNTFLSEIKKVEGEYHELDENHESYNEGLAKKLTEWYESIALVRNTDGTLRFKPNAPSFYTFVNDVMGVRAKAAESGKSAVTSKVLKQAARQPITSSGASVEGSKSAEDRIKDPNTSLEEAEAIANKAANG